VVTGEGGSGGALAIAVGDRVFMLENAVYSVISPEGCAGILWRDGSKAAEAAEALKITAADLLKLGAVDAVVPEKNLMAGLKKLIVATVKELKKLSVDELLDRRYAKLTAMGRFA
jgi:acetyl-CoA carboxylase carboxyl transferase subunit alpha